MSKENNSHGSSVKISGDFSSFVQSQQGELLFHAPVGLYEVLLRARQLHEGCVCVPFSVCPFCLGIPNRRDSTVNTR